MKRGFFNVRGYGKFKRRRSDYRSTSRRKGRFLDVMGTAWRSRKGAASGNAFIRSMGL